jgi:hypothetical protein
MVVTVAPPLVRRRGMAQVGLLGLGLGALWGAAARVFMRLVSTEPSFSWAGTLGIVGLSAVLGLGVALAGQARAERRSRWWWLVLGPGLLLFPGQGIPFLPGFVVGGLLLRRRNLLARLAAWVTILGPGVAFWRSDRLDEVHMLSAPLRMQLADLVGLPLLTLAMALAGDRLWGPRRERSGPHGDPRLVASADLPTGGSGTQTQAGGRQSDSPDLALSSRRSDSSLDAPAGPA